MGLWEGSPMVRKMLQAVRSGAAKDRSRIFKDYIAQLPRPLSIVDLGGAAGMWKRWGVTEADHLHLTLINNHHIDKSHQKEELYGSFIKAEQEDVLRLGPEFLEPFDLVFSNSMMEHLESREAQARLASTIIRSGRPYFIQIPNKKSLIDPHFPHPFAPFFACLPRTIRAALLTLHPLGSGNRSKNYRESLRRMGFYNPIGQKELKALFPEAEIESERLFGLPMSIIALRKK